MGSTEPPSTPARTHAHAAPAEPMKICAMCGLPCSDGPEGFGTAGCPGCDPTILLRARRTRRRTLAGVA